MLEDSLKQSLIVSVGNPMIFVTRPVSVVLLILTVCMLISSFVRRKKPEWGEANAL
jgi:putative tricarboxylic transport membrane protein